jgi:hypothetical protein
VVNKRLKYSGSFIHTDFLALSALFSAQQGQFNADLILEASRLAGLLNQFPIFNEKAVHHFIGQGRPKPVEPNGKLTLPGKYYGAFFGFHCVQNKACHFGGRHHFALFHSGMALWLAFVGKGGKPDVAFGKARANTHYMYTGV